jgi:hypothetical protein
MPYPPFLFIGKVDSKTGYARSSSIAWTTVMLTASECSSIEEKFDGGEDRLHPVAPPKQDAVSQLVPEDRTRLQGVINFYVPVLT